MSLSDRERRLLEEMEAALATEDPRLQTTLAGSATTLAKPRLLAGALSLLAGVALLFTGLISKTTPLGVAGFIVALVGLILIIRSLGAVASSLPRPKGPRTSLSDRLEERWNRRNFEQ
jgi:Protein of unknown function (DUF3040)